MPLAAVKPPGFFKNTQLMTVHEEIKLFEKTVLELGFERVGKGGERTFRWYINPILYVDIEFRAHYLLYTGYTKIGKQNEPLSSLEYKQIIHRVDDLLWLDKNFIKRVVQSIFANMISEHIDLAWGTVLMR